MLLNKKKRRSKAEELFEAGPNKLPALVGPDTRLLATSYALELDLATRRFKLIDRCGSAAWCSQPNECCTLVHDSGEVWVKYLASGLLVKSSTIFEARPAPAPAPAAQGVGAASLEVPTPAPVAPTSASSAMPAVAAPSVYVAAG